jgi:type I restriction enzyme S subunit
MSPNWKSTTWGELATIEYGKGLLDYRDSDGGYPVYGTNGKIGRHTEPLFDKAGVIIGRKGAYRGIHYSKTPFFVIDTAFYLKPKIEFDLRWAYYQLLTQDINGMDSGSAIPSTSRPDFYALPVILPPLSEQRAIAGILGALDDKVEVNRRMNVTLESMARAVFGQWFVDSEEVGNWEITVLNDLAESILGGDWGKDTNEDGTLLPAFCIRGADIPDLQSGGTGKMPLRYIKSSSLEKRKLQAGDIVVEISGGSPTQSTGRPVFISNTLLSRLQHPLVASNFCRVFRPKDTIVSNFVYFWLRFLYSRDEFFQYENGTTGIKNFAFTIFCEQYYLSMPPKKILEKYHQFTTTIFETMQRNAKESHTLGSLRDSLLPKLMSREVRVKNMGKYK